MLVLKLFKVVVSAAMVDSLLRQRIQPSTERVDWNTWPKDAKLLYNQWDGLNKEVILVFGSSKFGAAEGSKLDDLPTIMPVWGKHYG